MAGPYTGADYAKDASVKADWATADYMRRCMFQAMKDWNDLPKAEQTAENGRKLWSQSPLKNDVLVKAGTAEVVGEYYKFLTDKSRVSDEKMLACLKSLDKKSIDGIQAGLEKNDFMAMFSAATNFSDAGKKYLGIESLSKSYQSFLKEHQQELATITVNPQPFTIQQTENIRGDQKLFNFLDNMDDVLSKAGLGSPATQYLNAEFSNEKEQLVNTLLAQTYKLRMDSPRAQSEALAELKKLNPAIDIASIKDPIQLEHISDDLVRTAMKLRTTSKDMDENTAMMKRGIGNAFASVQNLHSITEKEFDQQLTKFLPQLQQGNWSRRIGDGKEEITLAELRETLKNNGIDAASIDTNHDGKIGGRELSTALAKLPILTSTKTKDGLAK